MLRRLIALALVTLLATAASGAVIVDPGFESYDVASGQFVMPTSGPWEFTNNAGVVEPLAPSSSLRSLFTWSATRPAFEGAQYASTFAGNDTILQRVTFDAPGQYELSVAAFASSGTVKIFPDDLTPDTLVDGRFQFRFNGAPAGPEWVVPKGGDWSVYSTTVDVASAGTYEVGIVNPRLDPYFIAYDAFQVRPIPEPGAAFILIAAACATIGGRKRAR